MSVFPPEITSTKLDPLTFLPPQRLLKLARRLRSLKIKRNNVGAGFPRPDS
jgi:hypothetical protein